MLGRRAKIVSADLFEAMLADVANGRSPARDRVILFLSVKASLRACEIVGLVLETSAEASMKNQKIRRMQPEVTEPVWTRNP